MILTPERRTGRRRKLAAIGLIGREEGATAILIALLALFVLLPLAGLATSSFIRVGTVAELSLAADAGSLAGAASIPVGDIDFVSAYIDLVDGEVDDEQVDALIASIRPAGAPTPLQIARKQCLDALASIGRIGGSFDSGDPITCEPSYIADLDFVNAFGACFTVVRDNPDVWPYLEKLRNALPGLLHPGIKVTATRGVNPPLEALVGTADPEHSAVSYARRRFKNAIVLPIIVVPPIVFEIPGVTTTVVDVDDIPLNPLVEPTQAQIIAALQAIDDAIDTYNDISPIDFPTNCRGILPALADDIQDLVNPPEGGPTSDEVLDEADAQGGQVQVVRLFGFTPFFDFLPICVNRGATGSFEQIECAANAPGAFRATLVRG